MVAGRSANVNYLVEGRFRFNSERYFILNANPPVDTLPATVSKHEYRRHFFENQPQAPARTCNRSRFG